jgi:prolyl-tRNA synthetase
MKDLYTFDYNVASALETYHQVREMYAKIFDELKIPYLVADADSGNMGGSLSHEFHFPAGKGEDNVISCDSCNYVANEELAESAIRDVGSDGTNIIFPTNGNTEPLGGAIPALQPQVWRGISRDRHTLINVWYANGSHPSSGMSEVNLHAVKAAVPEFDTSVEDPLSLLRQDRSTSTTQAKSLRVVNLVDYRIPSLSRIDIESRNPQLAFWPKEFNGQSAEIKVETVSQDPLTGRPLNLLQIKDGDPCARCATGTLRVRKAIELGHTFYLGTRYSAPLNAMVTVPVHLLKEGDLPPTAISEQGDLSLARQVPMQMGCYGIGVSRMIAAVAETLVDEKGLNWPRVMAPFEVVVVPGKGLDDAASEVYDLLSSVPRLPDGQHLDVVLDDRAESFPWKMRDADLVGYPVIIVAGRRWKSERVCEVQCRRLHVREELPLDQLPSFVESLLNRL